MFHVVASIFVAKIDLVRLVKDLSGESGVGVLQQEWGRFSHRSSLVRRRP